MTTKHRVAYTIRHATNIRLYSNAAKTSLFRQRLWNYDLTALYKYAYYYYYYYYYYFIIIIIIIIIIPYTLFIIQTILRLPPRHLRLRNDLYCVEWGVKLYSLTRHLDIGATENARPDIARPSKL